MGLFGLFGDSLEEKASKALEKVRESVTGVANLSASVEGETITLSGTAESMEAKTRAMEVFCGHVGDANVLNTIRVREEARPAAAAPSPEPEAPPSAPEAPAERIHEVVPGDTLGAIAQKYYGKASLYMKIFEANRDILDDPNLIKVGQKLRIPE